MAVVGAVGADVFGRVLRDELSARGIDVTYVTTLAAPTSLFTILVDEAGERTMIGERGASAHLALAVEARVSSGLRAANPTFSVCSQ